MQIFASLPEIEAADRHLLEAEKQLETILKDAASIRQEDIDSKPAESIFLQKIQQLKSDVELKAEAFDSICLMAESDCLLPDTIPILELIEEEKGLPDWFEIAVQKELQKHKPNLHKAIKKMFRSTVSDYQKQSAKNDQINLEAIIKRMVSFDKSKLSNSQILELISFKYRLDNCASKYKRFLLDCTRKVMHFLQQNQINARNFSSSNKQFVQDMRSPEQYMVVDNAFPQRHNYHQRTPTGSQPISYNQSSKASFYQGYQGHRHMAPMSTTPSFYPQERIYIPSALPETSHNLFYRAASSLHRPKVSLAPKYPLNSFYGQFYY